MSEITIQADVAEKMAKYVAAADPILAKQAALDAAIPGAVDVLVSRGAVLADARDIKVAEFRADPPKLVASSDRIAEDMGFRATSGLTEIADSAWSAWQAGPRRIEG